MLIKELFALPIERNINPAVVVSANDPETIKAEIGEYVITDDLLERAYKFLDALANKKDQKSGIWINGYYGSGKSHFLKFMHYCLNAESSADAFEKIVKAAKNYDAFKAGNNSEITEARVKALQKKIIEFNCTNIMFNVEAVTDGHPGEKLTRIFLNMFNLHRGFNGVNIPLAILLEKQLEKAGKFQLFKDRIKSELHHNWVAEAGDLAGYKLESILEIAKTLLPELDIKALHNTLTNPESYHIGISSKLIPELKEYLEQKGDNYRLVFLVDEISQYIGSNKDILLNLQTIVEEVSTQLKSKIWIALTAQQSLEEVVNRFEDSNKSDEFGKILGRFDTRISLESNDASYITRKRVLDKNSVGIKTLNTLYNEKREFIEHQFKLGHDLYKGFVDAEDFILSYPFVPYQFRLIADVFSAFQRLGYVITEVKNNERSVIGVTHYTAKQHAGEAVGLFISFDFFFNDLFKNNLTHIGGRVINKALSLTYVATNEFAARVVRTLFMISNLEDSVIMTFPPSLDNITVLLMNNLDQNRLELQTKIKGVLVRLIEESIIREENNKYFFYSEDEIQVTNLIKNSTPTLDDRLTIVNDLLNTIIKVERKISFEQNDISIGYTIDEKDFLRNGDIKVNMVIYDNVMPADKAINAFPNDLYICLNEWFFKEEQFRKDLDWYIKTVTYFKTNSSAATGEREKTLQTFKSRNDVLKGKILLKLADNFLEAKFISQQQVLPSSTVPGAIGKDKYANIIRFHLDRVYKYMKMAAPYAKTAADLRIRVASSIQIETGDLPPAEAKVEEYISSNGNEVSIEDLVRQFTKIPFGWKDVAIIDMVIMLNARKFRDLEYKRTPRYSPKDFIEKAITTSERLSCCVKTLGGLDSILVSSGTKAFAEIFKRPTTGLSTDGYKLFDQLQEELKAIEAEYKLLQDTYHNVYPFGEIFKTLSDIIAGWSATREAQRFFRDITECESSTKEMRDNAEKIRQFIKTSLPKYDEIKIFILNNESNINSLDLPDQFKASAVKAFFMNADPASEFRVIVKQYDELKKALLALTSSLQKEAFNKYKEVFKQLDATAADEKIDYSTAKKDSILQRLQTNNNIAQLQFEISNADKFKNDEIEAILSIPTQVAEDGDTTPVRKTKRYKVSNIKNTISSQKELDEFVTKLSSDMQELLSDNTTIIID